MSHLKESEIIKYRLQQLKKLSYDLKQFTDTHNQPNYGILKQIIRLSKSNSTEKLHNNFSNKKLETFKPLNSVNQKQDIPPLFEYTKQTQEKFLDRIDSQQSAFPYHNINNSNSRGSPQNQKKFLSEIQQLRIENTQLQHSLKNLKKELNYYKSINQHEQQNTWKQGIPYFRMKQEIGAYITKVAISQSDYSKIAYKPYNVQLDIDKLSFRKGTKSKQNQYSIINLKEVFYYQDKFMILHFSEGNNDKQTVFLKFVNEQARHKWDLGFYINFKIVSSLSKNKQFSNDMPEIQIDKQKTKQQLKKMLSSGLLSYSKDDDKEIQQSQTKEKKESNQIDYTPNYELQKQKINKAKQLLLIGNIFNHLDKRKSDQQAKQQSEEKNLFRHFEPEKTNQKKQKKQEVKDLNTPSLKEQSSKTLGKGLESNENSVQSPKKNVIGIPSQRTSNEDPNSAWRNKMDQLLQVKDELNKGYTLTKYAEGGWSSHNKFIYLNKDGETLTFRDEQKDSDLKTIKIKQIINIKPGFIGKGIQKHVNSKNIKPQNFVVLEMNKKVIELGSQNKQRVKKFTQQLTYLHKELTKPSEQINVQSPTS